MLEIEVRMRFRCSFGLLTPTILASPSALQAYNLGRLSTRMLISGR